MKLESNDMTPLYVQLRNELLRDIQGKVYAAGEKIPTEAELSQIYGVSRITVRQAVQELCEEGWLIKKQGKGTFVQPRRISRKLDNMMSFTKSCLVCGMTPSTNVLENQITALPMAAQKLFGEDGSGQYQKIVRLRMADGIPVMLDINYFPLPEYSFLQSEDLTGSLYHILGSHGVQVKAYRNTTLDIVTASKALARKMMIGVGTPLFYMVEKCYDQNDRLVHLGIEYTVGEYYHYSLEDYIVKDEEYDGI
ncbi:MAG: GntR family transcriptional regulator [Oscillospiraceae bacterium]|nr:GntR family transcriptional regulator [Oscillospiraceae bacterium]